MVMRSTFISARRSAFGAAVLAAACAFAAPVFAQAERQDDADRHPRSAERDRDRHRPAPRREGSRIVALPIRQQVRSQRHGGDDHAVPARPGQGQRRRRRRGSRRRFPNPVDGERRLECRSRAGRARRGGIRAQVPAEPDPGGHGRIRTLDGRDVLGHRAPAPCFAPRSAADDGWPRAAARGLARRLRPDPAPRRRVEDRSGPHRHGRLLCRRHADHGDRAGRARTPSRRSSATSTVRWPR